MPSKTIKTQGAAAPNSPVFGQFVACAVALGIMGLGAWSLLGQTSRYHSDGYDADVTRNASDLTDLGKSN